MPIGLECSRTCSIGCDCTDIPVQGFRNLRLSGLLDIRHMKVAALGVGHLYDAGDTWRPQCGSIWQYSDVTESCVQQFSTVQQLSTVHDSPSAGMIYRVCGTSNKYTQRQHFIVCKIVLLEWSSYMFQPTTRPSSGEYCAKYAKRCHHNEKGLSVSHLHKENPLLIDAVRYSTFSNSCIVNKFWNPYTLQYKMLISNQSGAS